MKIDKMDMLRYSGTIFVVLGTICKAVYSIKDNDRTIAKFVDIVTVPKKGN